MTKKDTVASVIFAIIQLDIHTDPTVATQHKTYFSCSCKLGFHTDLFIGPHTYDCLEYSSKQAISTAGVVAGIVT